MFTPSVVLPYFEYLHKLFYRLYDIFIRIQDKDLRQFLYAILRAKIQAIFFFSYLNLTAVRFYVISLCLINSYPVRENASSHREY
jgi:hypothetical protein